MECLVGAFGLYCVTVLAWRIANLPFFFFGWVVVV
jgi:hypothetical protein